MNDDLKFNNIPSAELEKLSRELEEKNSLDENVTEHSETVTENFSDSESSDVSETQPVSDYESKAEDYKSEPSAAQSAADENVSVQNVQSVTDYSRQPVNRPASGEASSQSEKEPPASNVYSQSSSVQSKELYPQNTGTNRPPRTNTLRNRNAYPQNGYQYPPNTSRNNQYPRTNTLRNRNGYPQNNYNNNYSQNEYARTNTAINRNSYPPNNYSNNYPQNGYHYPTNGNRPLQNNNIYAQTPYSPGHTPQQPPYFYQPSPKELEKLALSKDASTAGKVTIAIYIVMFVVAIIIEIVAVLCGVSKDVPDLANDPYAGFTPMGFYMYEGLTSLLSIFLPTLLIIKASGKKINKLMPFRKIEGKKLLSIVMCGMSLCMVAQLMATLIGVNLGLFGIDIYEGLETATATGIMDLIMSTICTAIIPALVEEFAYRGLVAGILKEHDEMLAVFGSAFLFGMLHGNFGQIPFAFVVGLVLGYVRVKTDSMLPGILIHFGNNFYATVITILGEILPEPYSSIVDAAVIFVLIVIGFISTNYLVKNHKDLFKVEKKQSYLTYKEKLNVFLKTGTVLASIILLTVMSFVVLLVV